MRAFGLVVSDVPRPYMNAIRLTAVQPAFPPNPAGHGRSVGVLSCDGVLRVGLPADARLDVGDACRAPGEALAALRAGG